MPSGLQAINIQDVMNSTLGDLGKFKLTDIASDIQEFVAFDKMFSGGYVETKPAGVDIQTNLMVKTSGTANNEGLYDTRDYKVNDNTVKARTPWRHNRAHYVMDAREVQMNASPAMIVDLVKERRKAAFTDLATLTEDTFWSKPVDSTDTVTPYGLFYWLVANTGTPGFLGGNPAGFASGAGDVSSVTYPRWRNWAGGYTTVSKTDLIAKMRKAKAYTTFTPPMGARNLPDYNTGNNYAVYVGYDTLEQMERIGEGQNDNLGRDLAPMDGRMSFHGAPIVRVPKLDDDATAPVIMMNWGVFKIMYLEGFKMREVPGTLSTNSSVGTVDILSTWNTVCRDRRRLAIFTLA
jgi:hypothetical protein